MAIGTLIASARARITRLRDDLRKYRLHVWLLEGKEKHSGDELVILYVGHLLNKNYIAHLAYGDDYQETHLCKAWIWNVAKIVRITPAIALLVIETEESYFKRFCRTSDFYIPCWVNGDIEFARYDERAKHSENLQSDLRKIKKKGYQYEITRDKDKLYLFYYKMYRPYIIKAHGNRAALMSYEAMINKADITDLILLKRGDDYVAGAIFLYENEGVRAWSIGVVDGNYRYVKDGVVSALYYYKINYIRSRGFDRFNSGASRAFLNDGVLQYKKKWGLLLRHPRSGGFWIRALSNSAGLKQFLRNNPFLYCENAGIHGAIFVDERDRPSEDNLKKIKRLYCIPGIDDLSQFVLCDDSIYKTDVVANILD